MKKRININGKIYEQVSMNESLFKTVNDRDWDPLPDGSPSKRIEFKGGLNPRGNDELGAANIFICGTVDEYDVAPFEIPSETVSVIIECQTEDYEDDDDIVFYYKYFPFDDEGLKEANKFAKKIMRDLENGIPPYKLADMYDLGVQFL